VPTRLRERGQLALKLVHPARVEYFAFDGIEDDQLSERAG